MNMKSFQQVTIDADFCVVGGGMAGVCAAVAAARHGAKTVLVQDRPMLGGNASSEIRMWICGAVGINLKETGILEEIQLENMRYNPSRQYNIWDHILINFVQRQKNLTLLLNCSCDGVEMDGSRIKAVNAWQLTTQKQYTINAKFFADCSGDSVLRVSGAEFRAGREARSEYNESHAPEVADNKTMGNSILIQTKHTNVHKPFEPLPFAHVFEEKGYHRPISARDNFWWVETGGEQDTIADAEEIRDELAKIIFGVWDLTKNSSKGVAKNFEIEWIGVLPGKRENIRYIGDHVLTQNDVEKQGKFDDMIGYGGWSMDDHHPAAFYHPGAPTIFHPAPKPYGIPYRSLYSKNIDNLFFAGRNISATHMAMSSTRVMGTCAILGQAAGTAAALAVRYNLSPRGIYEEKITELQETLMDDDCWIPWHARKMSDLTQKATLSAEASYGIDPEVLRNGIDRGLDKKLDQEITLEELQKNVPDAGLEPYRFVTDFGKAVEYRFEQPELITEARMVFDSNVRDMAIKRLECYYPENGWDVELPDTLIKEFSIQIQTVPGGEWQEVAYVEDNFQRLVRIPVGRKAVAIRLIPEVSWGADKAYIHAFDIR